MGSKSFRSSVQVREEIGIQEETVQTAKSALTDLLAPVKLAKSLGDRIRGYEGSVLHLVVDPDKGETVMKLGVKLKEARVELRTVETRLPRKELIERAEERVHNSVRYLGKLRNELIDTEGREAVEEVRSGKSVAAK